LGIDARDTEAHSSKLTPVLVGEKAGHEDHDGAEDEENFGHGSEKREK
jgi:hypothetical protein